MPRHRLMLRLQEGKYKPLNTGAYRYGTFEEATQLARNILEGRTSPDRAPRCTSIPRSVAAAAAGRSAAAALRARRRDDRRQPSDFGGRPRLRCARFGDERRSGTRCLHPRSAREHYLQHGWGRHTCLGQFVSPVIIVESMIAVLGLQDLARPRPRRRARSSARAAFRPPAARRSESLCDDVLVEVRGRGFHA